MIIDLLIDLVTDAAAVLLAMGIVPGLHPPDGPLAIAAVVLMFAVLSLLLRPLVFLLTIPVVLLITGPSLVLFNALILWFCLRLSNAAGLNFRADGITALLLGTVVILTARMVAAESRLLRTRRRASERERAQLKHLEFVRDWMQGERDRFKKAAEERRRTP